MRIGSLVVAVVVQARLVVLVAPAATEALALSMPLLVTPLPMVAAAGVLLAEQVVSMLVMALHLEQVVLAWQILAAAAGERLVALGVAPGVQA